VVCKAFYASLESGDYSSYTDSKYQYQRKCILVLITFLLNLKNSSEFFTQRAGQSFRMSDCDLYFIN